MRSWIKRGLKSGMGSGEKYGAGLIVYLALSLLVIVGLVIVVVKLYGWTSSSAEERDDAFRLLEDAEQKLEARNAELYEQRLDGAFTDEQIVALTEQFVEYDLYVNNRKVEEDQTIVYSQTPRVMITFYEKFGKDARKLFPDNVLYKTSKVARAVLEEKILVSVTKSEFEFKEMVTEEGIRTDLVFGGVEPGEIITLDLDYEFSELLGLQDSSIEIFYNVTTGGN